MSESSSGTVLSHCIFCQEPFSESFSFCTKCGVPRSQMKQCLLCHHTIPDIPQCNHCFAPQNLRILQNMPLKKCINSQCDAILVLALLTCYKCRQQQHIQLPSFPQSETLQADSLPHHSGLPMTSYSQTYGSPFQGSFTQTSSQPSVEVAPQASAGVSMSNFNVNPISYQTSFIPGQTDVVLPLDPPLLPHISGTVCHPLSGATSAIHLHQKNAGVHSFQISAESLQANGSTQTTNHLHTPSSASSGVSSPFQMRPVQPNVSAPNTQTSFGYSPQTGANAQTSIDAIPSPANNAHALFPQPISSANFFLAQTNTDTQSSQTNATTDYPQNINANAPASTDTPSSQMNNDYVPSPQTSSTDSSPSQATQSLSTSATADHPQNINANALASTDAPSSQTNNDYAHSPQTSITDSSPQTTQSFSTSAANDHPQNNNANALASTDAPSSQTNNDYAHSPQTSITDSSPQTTQSFSTSAAIDHPQNNNANAPASTDASSYQTNDDYAPSHQMCSTGCLSQTTQSSQTSATAGQPQDISNAKASTGADAFSQTNNDCVFSPHTSSADSSSLTNTDTQSSQTNAATGQPQDRANAETSSDAPPQTNDAFPQTSNAKSLPFQNNHSQTSLNAQNSTDTLPSQKNNVSAIPPHISVPTSTNVAPYTSVAPAQADVSLSMVSTSSQTFNSSNFHENPDSIGEQSEFHTPPSSPLLSASDPPIAADSNCEESDIATNEKVIH